MKSIKDLFTNEIRSSMLFLCIGISISISGIVGYFQYQQLRSDFQLTEQFILETTKNALSLEQPIIFQRSILEFWKAFQQRDSSIEGIEVFLSESLVSQAGFVQRRASLIRFDTKRCFTTSEQNICTHYFVAPIKFITQLIYILLVVFMSTLAVYFLRRKIAIKNIELLVAPLETEISRIAKISKEFQTPNVSNGRDDAMGLSLNTADVPIREISQLSNAYKELLVHSQKYLENEKSVEISKSLSDLAAQVSHDIRSPLTVLNLITSGIVGLPEDLRITLRSATTRINDVANQLLQRGQSIPASHLNQDHIESSNNSTEINRTSNLTIELLPAIVDMLVTEKRIQFREQSNVIIDSDLEESYGAFAEINSSEFKRVLSNIINNSVEAMRKPDGKIVVSVKNYNSKIILSVRDNGSGIPSHILEKLGQQGVTYGKEGTDSGSGLGVYHAKKTIEGFGAKFVINSREGIGTEIRMEFSKSATPEWFVPELNLASNNTILALDDDSSVLEIWKTRFKYLSKNLNINLITFTSETEFILWIENNRSALAKTLFLMDYELLGQKKNGLDLIEEFNLNDRAILVTSRYEELLIKNRCQELKVKQIPKGMAPFIPIQIE